MSDWIEWKGGECPVAPTTLVNIRLRADPECDDGPCPAGGLWWDHDGSNVDIIAYRLSTPASAAATGGGVADVQEKLAIMLWHRFAPEHHLEWEGETHKAEYRLVARDALPMLAAAPPPPAQAVPDGWRPKVRPIDWRDMTYKGVEEWIGHCALSQSFTIKDAGGSPEYRFVVRPFLSGATSFPSADAAKDAAQADYEARILSALVTPPAPEAGS